MWHMIESNIWKDGIMKQVVTFGMFTILMLSKGVLTVKQTVVLTVPKKRNGTQR